LAVLNGSVCHHETRKDIRKKLLLMREGGNMVARFEVLIIKSLPLRMCDDAQCCLLSRRLKFSSDRQHCACCWRPAVPVARVVVHEEPEEKRKDVAVGI
jgi:hypothetical protein